MQPRLILLTKWPEHHPWPTVKALRHLVLHRDTNGFSEVVRKAGGRVLIDEQKFFEWVDKQQLQSGEEAPPGAEDEENEPEAESE